MTSVKYDYSFLAGFINADNNVELNNYTLTFNLYITDEHSDYQLAFDRMDYFVNNIIDNSIFVNEGDVETIDRLTKAEFNVLTIPDPGPIDQMVQLVLITKFNNITEDIIQIFESELSSFKGGYIKYMYYVNEVEDSGLLNDNPRKWWNDSSPRAISIDDNSDIVNFKDVVRWSDLDLGSEEEVVTAPIDNIIKMKNTNEPDFNVKAPDLQYTTEGLHYFKTDNSDDTK